MTVYYVDSAGSNTAPYDTWAKAANLLATIAAIDVAGDTIYCASTGSESTVGSLTLAWAGTPTNPTRIVSADKTSGAPPATVAAGYSVSATNLINANQTGFVYASGITVISGNSISSTFAVSDNCSYQLSAASGTNTIGPAGATWINGTTVKFGAVGQSIASGSLSPLKWSGGGIAAGSVSPTSLFSSAQSGQAFVENTDFSGLNAAFNLSSSTLTVSAALFRNIKLPASWTGALNAVTPGFYSVFTLNNCDSAGTNYILHRQTQFGDIYSETTIVRSGGASDGTTPLSWKMVSLAASGTFPITALQTGEFISRNNNISAPVTVTVEFVHDSLTGLKDNEIWIEVDYYAASGNPQGTLASSAMANVLATPATLASSSASWTTTGLTNPNTQKMSVTFTPNLKGSFLATVKLCKSAYTVYVDPKMTLS